MLPLNELDAMLAGDVPKEVETELIEENTEDGEVLRRAAQEGLVNVVKFLLDAAKRRDLTVLERLKCSNDGAVDNAGTTPLHHAAAGGHSAVVEAIITSGASVNVKNKEHDTPLTLACEGDHEAVVNILVRKSAFLDDFLDRKSPLQVAIKNSKISIVDTLVRAGAHTHRALYDAADSGREDVVQLLLDHVPDVKYTTLNRLAIDRAASMGHLHLCQLLFNAGLSFADSDKKESPLHSAVKSGSLKLVRCLLACGVSVECFDSQSQTPLHYAAESGHLEIVKSLLSSGANIDAQDQRKRTALYLASFCGYLEIVQFLVANNAKTDIISSDLTSPLDAAIESGHRNVALLLFPLKFPLNKTCLLNSAIENGRTLALLCLLQSGVDLNPPVGSSLLHIACKSYRVDYAKVLLEKGASINAQNERNETPLLFACRMNEENQRTYIWDKYFSLQKFLIKNGADIHIPDYKGCTLLHMEESTDLVRLLMHYNALVDARDSTGSTPLHCIHSGGSISKAKLLIKYGASVNAKNKDGVLPLESAVRSANTGLVELLLENGAESNIACSDGGTLLHLTSVKDNPAIANVLIKHNADMNATNKDKCTPLHVAVQNMSNKTARFLIVNGARVNAADCRGATPLHVAAQWGDKYLVACLLEYGGNASIQNRYKETPLDRAIKLSRSEVEEILRSHILGRQFFKLNV